MYFRGNICFVLAVDTLFFVVTKIRNFERMDSFCSINIANFYEVIKLNYLVTDLYKYTRRLMYSLTPVRLYLTHCGRVTQICVFNTVKLGTSASSS